jgi:hypothetical protein
MASGRLFLSFFAGISLRFLFVWAVGILWQWAEMKGIGQFRLPTGRPHRDIQRDACAEETRFFRIKFVDSKKILRLQKEKCRLEIICSSDRFAN